MLHNTDGIIIQHTVMIFFVSGGATVSSPDALRFPGFEASRTGILEGIVKDREMKALPSKQDFPAGDCRERREDEDVVHSSREVYRERGGVVVGAVKYF